MKNNLKIVTKHVIKKSKEQLRLKEAEKNIVFLMETIVFEISEQC